VSGLAQTEKEASMGIKLQQLTEREPTYVDVTSDFCYTQAAKLLSGGSGDDYLRRNIVTPEDVAHAAEWRKLGDTLWESEQNGL
jgi:hypothetical protein